MRQYKFSCNVLNKTFINTFLYFSYFLIETTDRRTSTISKRSHKSTSSTILSRFDIEDKVLLNSPI